MLSDRTNLCRPRCFRVAFLLKNEHDVACHALLSNQNLLLPINDEVAALVIATLAGVFYDLRLGKIRQVAEL